MDPSQFDPRRPELHEAAEALEQALTDACASKSAHDADTGELLRIEEMLALASDAAKRAILLRRRARLRGRAARAEAAAPEGPADQPPTVQPTHRLFDDANGVRWDVWAVHPELRSSQLPALPGTFQSGWLVFESANEKRRLGPIPGDWQTLPLVELERLCERAQTAQRRRRTPGRGGGRSEDTPPRAE